MVKTADDIKSILKDHQRQINAFGIKHIRLFGSFARGEQNIDSDVDLLASFEGEISFDKLYDLENYLAALMGRPVQVVDEKTISERFKKNVDMNRNKPLSEILEDILQQIDSIEKIRAKRIVYENMGDREVYLTAIAKYLENIGEACSRIQKHHPDFFQSNDASMGFRKLIDQRNRLSHGYDTVNHSLVESNVKNNLEALKKNVAAALTKENDNEMDLGIGI